LSYLLSPPEEEDGMKGIQAQAFLTFPSSFTFWNWSSQREEWRLQASITTAELDETTAPADRESGQRAVLGKTDNGEP